MRINKFSLLVSGLWWLVMVLAAHSVSAQVAHNLIRNGNFEDWSDGEPVAWA